MQEIRIQQKTLGMLLQSKRKLVFIICLCVFLLSCFVLLYPFIRILQFNLFPSTITIHPTSKKTKSTQKNNVATIDFQHTAYDLIIPKIGVNAIIGRSQTGWHDLDLGTWFYPASATPDKGGNTVILGHRFEYTPPSNITFYLMDKLTKNDLIYIYWNNKQYRFHVTGSVTIPANKELNYINKQTPDNELMLVTCTPLWTATDRLIIYAKP